VVEEGDGRPGYFDIRLTKHASRAMVWRHIARYLERWIPADARILELGAGYCDFSNTVRGATKVALDQQPGFERYAAAGVRTVLGDCTDLGSFSDGEFTVVFASNLVEHLDRHQIARLLAEVSRVLSADGRLILVQPNFRLSASNYFDDYTHVSIHSDRSLPDLLRAHGFEPERVEGRFLPFTMKSRLAGLHRLVPLYLRLPYRPFAGQMLVVARGPGPTGSPS
jgi:SAM-dependent methyltransferase